MALYQLMALLLVASSCYCAPSNSTYYGLGFSVGGESHSNWALGGKANVTRDNLALTVKSDGVAAGKWRGKAIASGHADINGKHYAGKAEVSSKLDGSVKPNYYGTLGIGSNKNFQIAAIPGLTLDKSAELSGDITIQTGEDNDFYNHIYGEQ